MDVIPEFSRKSAAALLIALVLALAPAVAEARAGGGFSFGSRGGRTFSPPPITSTAPRGADPINRSMTPFSQPSFNQGFARPGGFFGGGLGRGFIGGLLGAGLFGLLFGHGLFGGIGGFGSIFGLLIQLALIFFVVRLAMNWFRSRQPQFAAAGPQTSYYGAGSAPGGAPQAPPSSRGTAISLKPDDFNQFERMLSDIELAYGDEDLNRLRNMLTPEMASYFAEELADNARKGVVNHISGVHLVQGDLSEAWREADGEYATTAMRFSLVDVTLERATNRVVDGDATAPQEVTEVWTFRRPVGAGTDAWRLAAIQQA